jgi:hypothetical protein
MHAMTPITIHCQPTPEIMMAAYTLHIDQDAARLCGAGPLLLLAKIVAVLAGVALFFLAESPGWAMVAMVAYGLALVAHSRLTLRAYVARDMAENHQREGYDLTIDDKGLNSRIPHYGESSFSWRCVREVREMPGGWLAVILESRQIYPVPDAAFIDAAQRRAFIDAIGEGLASVAEKAQEQGSGSAAAGPSAEDAAAVPPLSSWRDDLRQGWRVLTCRAPRPDTLQPTPLKLILPVPLFYLITLGIEVAKDGSSGTAIWYGIYPILSLFAAVALFVGLLLLLGGEPRETRWQSGGRLWLILNWLLLLWPMCQWWNEYGQKQLSAWGWSHSDTWAQVLLHAPFYGFLFIAMVQAVLAGIAGRFHQTALRFGYWLAWWLALPVLSVALWLHKDLPPLWYVESDEEESFSIPEEQGFSISQRIDEDVLYGQTLLLERHLAALRPGRAGVAEIFFLGVGGSHQGVFLRETQWIEQLFKDRFHTDGHSLILVNNASTLQEQPLANKESLRRALQRIGERMNVEEDVLFLSLTSHGSSDHRLSILFQPFAFADITPAMLREMLDGAGIKYRVIVVSACYSGGFIPALRDENTLVISAAAHDRNSFGCNDENEMTDFGRAYFDEALRQTRSFTEAFAIAATHIAEREKAEERTPSLPQMAEGSAIGAKLAVFESESPPSGSGRQEEIETAYLRIARSLVPDDDFRMRDVCLETMHQLSPRQQLSANPDAFNGMEQDPFHWNRYLAAWERSAASLCGVTGDPLPMRERLARAWRQTLPLSQADAMAEWLERPETSVFLQAHWNAGITERRLAEAAILAMPIWEVLTRMMREYERANAVEPGSDSKDKYLNRNRTAPAGP